MRRLMLIGTLLALAWPATAAASGGRWGLDDRGDPLLTAPAAVRDESLGAWWVCPPGQLCRPIVGRIRQVAPGETAPATVFEHEIFGDFGNGPTDERSPFWLGRVRATTQPALEGVAAVGSTVKPIGARWTGGWGHETDALTVIECPRRDSRTNCRNVTAPLTHGGWYLYAVDRRVAADRDPDAPVGLPAPPDAPTIVPPASALVAVSNPVGPIATTATAPDPNASYTVTLRSRALVDRRDITVGRISCPQRCKVVLSVAGQRRSFSALGTVPLVVLSAPRLRGKLQVRVSVDGRRAAAGVVG